MRRAYELKLTGGFAPTEASEVAIGWLLEVIISAQ